MKYDVEEQYLELYPYYGRFGQDRYIHENFFLNKKDGLFVDIGAYDGVESSNTLFFEESLRWRGICVEPLTDIFSKLKANRNCLCLDCCASDHNGFSDFLHVKPNIRPKQPNGKRTSNYEKLSGLTDFYCDAHKKTIDDIILAVGGEKNLLSIKCQHVNDILSMLNTRHIDLLSIDTEGSELHILKNIDFTKYTFSIIIVEELYDDSDLNKFMDDIGYRNVTKIGYDSIFSKKIS
jgi:FkbM family methyltransferase